MKPLKECEALEWCCPYCGDSKPSTEGEWRGCCGEAPTHWVERCACNESDDSEEVCRCDEWLEKNEAKP